MYDVHNSSNINRIRQNVCKKAKLDPAGVNKLQFISIRPCSWRNLEMRTRTRAKRHQNQTNTLKKTKTNIMNIKKKRGTILSISWYIVFFLVVFTCSSNVCIAVPSVVNPFEYFVTSRVHFQRNFELLSTPLESSRRDKTFTFHNNVIAPSRSGSNRHVLGTSKVPAKPNTT